MRLLAVPFLSLALIWAVVLWDASRREEAHLASGLADARGAMAFLWSKVDGVLDDAMGVLGAPGAVETLGATQGAATEGDRLPALDAPRARLFAANLGAMGVIVSLLDDRGRLLWREPNLGGLDMGTADQSLGVRLVLSEQRDVRGYEGDEGGFVGLRPLVRGERVVAVVKVVLTNDAAGHLLADHTPLFDAFRVLPTRDLDGLGQTVAPTDRALGNDWDPVLARLNRMDLKRGVEAGEPFALYAEGWPAAAEFLPLAGPRGTFDFTLVGVWPTDQSLRITTVVLPLLLGGTALVVLVLAVFWRVGRILVLARRERNRLRAVTDTMAEGLCVMDAENRILMVNAAAEAMLDYPAEEMVGRNAHGLLHAEAGGHVHSLDKCAINRAIVEGRSARIESEYFKRRSGDIFPVRVHCAPVNEGMLAPRWGRRSRSPLRRAIDWLFGQSQRDATGLDQMSVVTFTDMSDHHHSEATVNKLSQAVEQSSASVVITNADGVIEYVNPAFTRVSGYAAEEVLGRKPSVLKSGRMPMETYRNLWETITRGEAWTGEFHNRRKNGSLYWERATIAPIRDREGAVTHFVAVKDDVTQWKDVEQELFHRANYDALTGLPNRQFLLDRLGKTLAVARREGNHVAVLFMDLDRFKQVNDSMGHTAGDVLLKQAASRMAAVLRPQDTLGRLGGDEFLVVAPGLKSEAEAATIAARLLEVARAPFTIDDREVYVSGSIGIGIGPGDDAGGPLTAQALMRHADAAMYLAKEEGRDGYHFFTAELEASTRRRLAIETGLRSATTDGSLRLDFQPIIDSHTGRVSKVEALLRWTHPQLGAVGPDEFIPLAEETGQILSLGEWVIKAACDAVKTLAPPSDGSFRLAFNVSSKQFGEDVHGAVVRALAERDLDPRVLEVEITERLMLDPSSGAQTQLNALRAMGVRVAIDDFGTGYSALSYLTHFHIDTLKVDRAFVSSLVGDLRAQALIGAITGMAHGLDCDVVAEGVETREQAGLLKDLGVDALQGYLLGRPMGLEALMEHLGPFADPTGRGKGEPAPSHREAS
jgi:diguanylate cyclase (GGDEF)-like protein/PAS domain S-box-containing protein